MDRMQNLELLSEKTLPHAADGRLLAYCPSMDLIALGSTDQQVLIYRLNGQRVYGATQKAGTLRVEGIRWKPNGQLLAIAWSDGSIRLVGAESSKIVHQFSAGTSVAGITCIGWASNLTSKTFSAVRSHKIKQNSESWRSIFALDQRSEESHLLDLPRDLSLIDIETSLPKLSVLAAGGSSEEAFSSRSSLDALFRPFDPKDNEAVDVMVVGTKEGDIHLSIYDSFIIGSFTSPIIIGGHSSQLVLHASHQKCSTHSLIMKSSVSGNSLHFVPMDLRFVSASSHYLSLLASRSTALQNLLRYIHQVQILMLHEWKATQELPAKFLRNINETLGEKGSRNIVQALYHSVATGHTFPAVREWLVDELTERGHKRWDKVVVAGLETLRRLVHENMLPALDRCSVILSRFMGLAKFQGPNEAVGFTTHQISLMMDTVACLHLVSSRILTQVVDELDLFAAFSTWLRYEIDRLASESSNSTNEEVTDKEASIDHSKVLLYLQTVMTSSPSAIFFGDSLTDVDWSESGHDLPMFNLLAKQLQNQEKGQPYTRPPPRVEFFCNHLVRQANIIFSQIAEAEKRNVLFGKAHELGVAQSGSPMDMRISQMEGHLWYSYVAFVPQSSVNLVQIWQITFVIENGISTVHSTASSTLQLGSGRVKDMKFFNDHTLLALWESKGTTTLLSMQYHPHAGGTNNRFQLEYFPRGPKLEATRTKIFSDADVLDIFSKYAAPGNASFVPERIEIREGKSQASDEDKRRIVVLSQDRLHYKVLKFPKSASGNEQADEDIPMS